MMLQRLFENVPAFCPRALTFPPPGRATLMLARSWRITKLTLSDLALESWLLLPEFFPQLSEIELYEISWISTEKWFPFFEVLRALKFLNSIHLDFALLGEEVVQPNFQDWQRCFQGLPVRKMASSVWSPAVSFFTLTCELPLHTLHLYTTIPDPVPLPAKPLMRKLALQELFTDTFLPELLSPELRRFKFLGKGVDKHLNSLHLSCPLISEMTLWLESLNFEEPFPRFKKLKSLKLRSETDKWTDELMQWISGARLKLTSLTLWLNAMPQESLWVWVFTSSWPLVTLTIKGGKRKRKIEEKGLQNVLESLLISPPEDVKCRKTLARFECEIALSQDTLELLCKLFENLVVLRLRSKPEKELPVSEVEVFSELW